MFGELFTNAGRAGRTIRFLIRVKIRQRMLPQFGQNLGKRPLAMLASSSGRTDGHFISGNKR